MFLCFLHNQCRTESLSFFKGTVLTTKPEKLVMPILILVILSLDDITWIMRGFFKLSIVNSYGKLRNSGREEKLLVMLKLIALHQHRKSKIRTMTFQCLENPHSSVSCVGHVNFRALS